MKAKQSVPIAFYIAAVVCLAAAISGRVDARLSLATSSEEVSPTPSAGADNTTVFVADLLFILSAKQANPYALQATFPTATSVRFDNVSSSIQFYSAAKRTGIMPPAMFLNGSLTAPYVNRDGHWLNSPQAVLYGFSDGHYKVIILSLDTPVYDPAVKSVTFTVSIINPNTTALTLTNGTVNEVAAQYNSEGGLTSLLKTVKPDRTLTRAALFIDANNESLAPIAHLKDWNVGTTGWGVSFGGIGVSCTWGFACNLSWGKR